MEENILLKFSTDTKGIDTANQAVQELANVDKAVKDQFDRTNVSIKDREKTIGTLSGGLGGLVDKLKNAEKAAVGAFGTKGLTEFKRGLADNTSVMKLLTVSIGAAAEKLKTLGTGTPEYQKLNAEIEQGIQLIRQLGETEGETEQKSVSLRTKLLAMRQELALMEDQGKENTKEFQNLAIAAGRLQDQIGDTQTRIQALASDTANIDAVVQGVQTLAAGFQITAGASALFGNENEDLQKTLVKLNGIMAITTGIREVYTNLQKQTILYQKLESVGNAVLGASTKAAGATFQFLGLAVTESSLAFKVLRTAIITTGIGALIVGIGYLIENFDKVKKVVMNLLPGLSGVADFIGNIVNKITDFIGITSDASRAASKAIDELTGKIKDQERFLDLNADKYDAYTRKKLEADADYKKKKLELLKDETLSDSQRNVLIDQALQQRNRTIDAADAERSAAAKNAHDDLLKKQQDANEKQQELAERNRKALFEIEERGMKATADLYKEGIDAPPSFVETRIAALENFTARQTALLIAQRDNELKNVKLTEAERKNIEDKYNDEYLKLAAETAQKRVDIYKDYAVAMKAAQQSEAESEKAMQAQLSSEIEGALKNRAELILRNVNAIYAKLNKGNAVGLDVDLSGLDAAYSSGLISLQQYEEKRAALKKTYADQEIDNDISRLEALIGNYKAYGISTDELEDQLAAKKDERRQRQIEKDKDTQAKERKILEDHEQKKAAIIQASVNLVSTLASGMFDAFQAGYEQDLEEVQALQDKKVITEQEAQKRIKAIHRQQAVAAKAEALFNIAISTAQAIARDLAGNKFLIPFDIAMGLAQTAFVLARPLPQLYRGTKKAKEGVYRTGELGQELMWHKDTGLTMLGKRGEEINFVPEGARVFNAAETTQITKHLNIAAMAPVPKESRSQAFAFDYGKLADAIVEKQGKFSDVAGINVNIDRNGIYVAANEGMKETEYLNRRYSVKL